jgi:hypothetical protein
VDNAFAEMANLAIKREASINSFKVPDSISGAGGVNTLLP